MDIAEYQLTEDYLADVSRAEAARAETEKLAQVKAAQEALQKAFAEALGKLSAALTDAEKGAIFLLEAGVEKAFAAGEIGAARALIAGAVVPPDAEDERQALLKLLEGL